MFDREALADLHRVLGEWLANHGAPQSVTEAEDLARQVAQIAGAAVVEHTLPGLAGRASYEGSRRGCGCGERAKFMGYRRRGVGTVYGVVEVQRAYYYCAACRRGVAPWDRRQGLTERLWTARVKELVVQLASRLPYRESVELLETMLGLRIEDSSAEEVMVEVGGRLREQQQAQQAGIESGELTPLVPQAPQRLYVSLDGTHAHLEGSWHEVKTAVVYEARPDAQGADQAQPGVYVAAAEPAEQFGGRLYAAAAPAGVQVAAETVVLADGAAWIWNLADHHYPGATQIVDVWHACQHIHALAQAYYGPDSRRGQRWAQAHCRRLSRHGPATLLGALKRMQPPDPQQAAAVRREVNYFTRHRHRMQYPQFRARGLMIGSGPVEAACKVVVGQRLKGAGMRWSAAGADAVLAVRTALLSRQPHLVTQAAYAPQAA